MTTRSAFTEWGAAQVGSNDWAGYCIKALGFDPGPKKAWCGIMLMAGLRELGMTDKLWGIDGSGMVGPLGLRPVARPEPGDIGYQDKPYQHHFMVETVDPHTYTSIDGNQGWPGVQRKHRAFKTTGIIFYSIAPLLRHDTEPAPPPSTRRPTLRKGATGEAVSALQSLLAPMFPGLVVDGQFGPQTAAVVMGFQRRAGLDADGIVGPKTWAALEKATP